MKVFVYGTLKHDGYLFMRDHVWSINEAHIKGDLYGSEWATFPFADLDGEGVIKGETHEIDPLILPVLDRIERMYTRRQVTTQEGDLVYVYHFDGIDETFTKLESGEWNNRGDNLI